MTEGLLDTISSPDDLKKLAPDDLVTLASEIRARIISVMSVNGGHLASNLGSVELTLALHYVFSAPDDKLIWDVSHQTYPHKLLTGRNPRFETIRLSNGLCGFCDPQESPYDHFHAGHAGTALSLALGVAKTRDLNGAQNTVIPIIGDATLTCGMSLEALNNIDRSLKRFIVILNDNEMSISKNVGAITRILSRILSNPTTDKIYHDIASLIAKIPSYGRALVKQGHKVTESLKHLVSPAAFFEQYGLSYIGPLDGHDVKGLVETLESLKHLDWPIILHVLTNKGQGMNEAKSNPSTYHGVKPFDPGTGKFLPAPSNMPTFPKIFGSEILNMAKSDPDIVAVTPAMSQGSCLDPMMTAFPDRVFDVGIAESHAVTFSGGLAYQGHKKVITSIYATFLQRAFDNLFHDVCLQELPVLFCIDRAGISGPDGSTHHGIYDIAFLNAMPNMVIAQPRNGRVLRELMRSAFSWNRPTAIRYPNCETEDDANDLQPRTLGKGELVAEGSDVLIIALGHMVNLAEKARALLAENGISAAIVDPVFVKPLDSELLCAQLACHSHLVIIEEHSAIAGLGSIINHFLMTHGYTQIQTLSLGIPETFLGHGSYRDILNKIGLTPEKVAAQITQFCKTAVCAH